MSERIGVIDYKAGNLKSVETALQYIKADFFTSANPEQLMTASRLIFPGVGDAQAAMQVLKESGMDTLIKTFFASGKPILGICLGTQIVFESSEERNAQCLGIVPGVAARFPLKPGFKIPHMGWNQVKQTGQCALFEGITDNTSFYFVHSYYPLPADKSISIGETDYIINFTSAIHYKNLWAVQFHPEKSGIPGLKMLENFIHWKI